MQAITTKYLPATNTKPARIKAECSAGSLTLSFSVCDEPTSPGTTPDERCAYALLKKLGWDDRFALASGVTKNLIGVHVLVPAKPTPGEHDEDYRIAAAEKYEDEGTLEIDPTAIVSISDDGETQGAYVQAWVWVYANEAFND
jgi:hypothetical protein